MKQVRIGLVGTGYIGRCHAIAYAQAPTVFPLDAELVLEYLAEVTPELAEKKQKNLVLNVLPVIGVISCRIRMWMWWIYAHRIFSIKTLRWRPLQMANTFIPKNRWH